MSPCACTCATSPGCDEISEEFPWRRPPSRRLGALEGGGLEEGLLEPARGAAQGRRDQPQGPVRLHDHHVYKAGIALQGTEVKSLRAGHASLADAFATVTDGEVWLRGLHIQEYDFGSWTNHEPRRHRKLLLHREEIRG